MTSLDEGSLHEIPSAGTEDDVFDSTSFVTVEDVGEDDEENNFPTSATATAATTTITSDNSSGKIEKTVYEKVKYHDDIGKLVLTSERITFAPYDGGSPTRGSVVALGLTDDMQKHSWNWSMIDKLQIPRTTTTSDSRCKLISLENKKKAVTFYMPHPDILQRISKDIAKRLKPYQMERKKQQQQQQSRNVVNGSAARENGTEHTPLLTAGSSDLSNNNSLGRSHKVVWTAIVLVLVILVGIKIYQSQQQ